MRTKVNALYRDHAQAKVYEGLKFHKIVEDVDSAQEDFVDYFFDFIDKNKS